VVPKVPGANSFTIWSTDKSDDLLCSQRWQTTESLHEQHFRFVCVYMCHLRWYVEARLHWLENWQMCLNQCLATADILWAGKPTAGESNV